MEEGRALEGIVSNCNLFDSKLPYHLCHLRAQSEEEEEGCTVQRSLEKGNPIVADCIA